MHETDFDLSGAVAVVTGATRGIGAQTAAVLGRAGARVVVVGRSSDAAPNKVMGGTLESVAAGLRAEGTEVLTVQADLTDPADTERIVTSTLEAFGRCDVLVNNAAYTSNGAILDIPAARWGKAMRAQVVAPLQLVQGFVPGMLERGSGRVVNISTGAATTMSPGLSMYSVSKRAMEHLNDYLDLELAGSGVSFTVLHIERIVTTETWQWVYDHQGADVATLGGSVSATVDPSEVADQIAWLATRPASWSGRKLSCADVVALGGPGTPDGY
jgi:NAD(P)-dependent dehydrogenase (short-subunit alcohol dehydrogenase family)